MAGIDAVTKTQLKEQTIKQDKTLSDFKKLNVEHSAKLYEFAASLWAETNPTRATLYQNYAKSLREDADV